MMRRLFSAVVVCVIASGITYGQTAARIPAPTISLDAPWAGSAECQIAIEAPGYSHREAHRWTITGGPTKNGNMEIYPATWSVTGDGSLQRVDGPSTQWTVNGTLGNVEVGVTRHVDRIAVQRWNGHGPARGGLTGVETASGTNRSRSIVLDVQQWPFPRVEDAPTSTRITGSSTEAFGYRGPMNPPAGAQGSATCSWDFTRGRQTGGSSQRGSVGTLAAGPQTAAGGRTVSTPTMTTTIVPSVSAVPQATPAVVNSGATPSNAPVAASNNEAIAVPAPNRQSVGRTSIPLASAAAAETTASTGAAAAARTIDLAGFTAQGVPGALRTIALGGFTATGAPLAAPRTIAITGWTATGASP